MKKIKLLLFAILVCLISISGVDAAKKLTCVYEQDLWSYSTIYGSNEYLYITEDSKISHMTIDPNKDFIQRKEQFTISFSLNGDVLADVHVIYKYSNGFPEEGKEYTSEELKPLMDLVNEIVLTNEIQIDALEMTEGSSCPEKITLGLTKDEKFLITTKGLKYFDDRLTHRLSTTKKPISEQTGSSQCYNYKNKSTCQNSLATGKVACVWVENESAPNGGYCNVDNLLFVGCGGASDIPMQVPALISLLVNLLKIATPIILIFISIITLVKAMAAQKEDEIKKATSSLIKKIIAAVLVFFVVAIVQFIVSVVAEDEYSGFENCLNCFLNNKCETTTYYKTVVGEDDWCTPLTTGESKLCEDMFK